MNLTPKIAEMLGVEIGEKFSIIPLGGTYRFTDKRLEFFDDKKGEWIRSRYFEALVTGDYGIEKIPFEPVRGENFCYIIDYCGALKVATGIWDDTLAVYKQKFCGNVFRTAEEAEKHKHEIYEKLTGKKWGK